MFPAIAMCTSAVVLSAKVRLFIYMDNKTAKRNLTVCGAINGKVMMCRRQGCAVKMVWRWNKEIVKSEVSSLSYFKAWLILDERTDKVIRPILCISTQTNKTTGATTVDGRLLVVFLYGDFSKTRLIQYLYEGIILWQIEFNFIIIGYCTNCHIFIILPAVTIFNLPTEKLSSSTNPTDGILVLFRRTYRKAYRGEGYKAGRANKKHN